MIKQDLQVRVVGHHLLKEVCPKTRWLIKILILRITTGLTLKATILACTMRIHTSPRPHSTTVTHNKIPSPNSILLLTSSILVKARNTKIPIVIYLVSHP